MNSEQQFIDTLNAMSADEQREHFVNKCDELNWTVEFHKQRRKTRYMDVIVKDKMNFHVNIQNSYIRQILREDYENICGQRIIKWSIFTAIERINDNYGQVMKVMIDTINRESE